MGYSAYKKIRTVTQRFNLDAQRKPLFTAIQLYEPSAWLSETLKKSAFIPLSNEKTKSERIISPILVEIAESYQDYITLFSGEELDVDTSENLSGECDFFLFYNHTNPTSTHRLLRLPKPKTKIWSTASLNVRRSCMVQNCLTKKKEKLYLF